MVQVQSPPFTAGFTRLRVKDDANGFDFPVSVWYPSRDEETARRAGIFDTSSRMDAAPVAGKFPLILLSHGSGGSDLNHHDWAETLARNGFVVAAPRHVGDSYDNQRGIASREQLLARPLQLRAARAAVESDARLSRLLAGGNIGLAGFSAGGYTCLGLLGARPDFTRWRDYCRRHPKSAVLCPVMKTPQVPDADSDFWQSVHEPRVGAAVLFAPFALLFSSEQLRRISVPMLVYKAEDESIARNRANADRVAAAVPGAEEVEVPGDHYVFIAPVADALARKYSEFYLDGPGVDRRAIHRKIGGEMVAFFQKHLISVRT
ncbi:MAG: hypothetical protein LIP23_02525 [Planctomycetes bacterium]|nr:hypothetical protein [Planctomycetota bacterium]